MDYKQHTIKLALNPKFKSTIETDLVAWSHDKNSYKFYFELSNTCGEPMILDGAVGRIKLDFLREGKTIIESLGIESENLGLASFAIPDGVLGYEGKVEAHVYLDYESQTHDLGSFSFLMKKSSIDNKLPDLEFYVSEWDEALKKAEELNEQIKDRDLVTRTELAEVEKKKANKESVNKLEQEVSTKAEQETVNKQVSDLEKEVDTKATKQETDNKLENKTDNETFVAITADMQRQINSTQSGMIGEFDSEAKLKAAYPNGARGYAVVWIDENGKKVGYSYTYKNNNWVKGQVWNGVGIPKKSITHEQLADDNISLFNIMNGQLSSDKILESVPIKKAGKNLFNKNKITKGYYFDGNELKFKQTTAADCILINVSEHAGQFLFQSHRNSHVIYNKDLAPIKGHPTNQLIELPMNAVFIGITIFKGNEDVYQIEPGKIPTKYEKYIDFIDGSELKEESIDKSRLIQEFVEPQLGKNIFNKEKVLDGFYPNYETGKISVSPTFSCSPWIEIIEGETYTKTDPANQQFCWYSDMREDRFISGSLNGNIMKAPLGAKYLLVAVRTRDIDIFQIEKGDKQTSYEPYSKYIVEEQLSPKIQKKLNPAQEIKNIKLSMIDTLYMSKDEEFSMYWRNIIYNFNDFKNKNYVIRVQKVNGSSYDSIGKDLGYKWYYTPKDILDYKIEIRIMNPYTDEIIDSKIINVLIVDKILIEKIKNLIVIGDSFTDGYGISKFIHDMITQDTNKTLNMLGLNDTGKEGVKDDAWSGYGYKWYHDMDRGYLRNDRPLSDAYWHAGWGENEINGWKTGQTYADLSEEQKKHGFTKNQFFNPVTKQFDFSYYMSTYQSNKKVDGFVSLLGLNDSVWFSVSSLKNNLPVYQQRITNIINSVKKYDSNIKIFLSLVTPQQENDSFMNSQGNEWLTSGRAKICQEIWNDFMIEKFGNRENEGIYIMPTHANFDYRYGILEGSYNPVKFDKSIVEKHARDVHPSEIGSKYIADTVRNWINGVLF